MNGTSQYPGGIQGSRESTPNMSQIRTLLIESKKVSEALLDSISLLDQRLSSVTRQPTVMATSTTLSAPSLAQENLVPLAEEIWDTTKSFKLANERIMSIIERLEI